MNNVRKMIISALVGLALTVTLVSFAQQDNSQTNQNNSNGNMNQNNSNGNMNGNRKSNSNRNKNGNSNGMMNSNMDSNMNMNSNSNDNGNMNSNVNSNANKSYDSNMQMSSGSGMSGSMNSGMGSGMMNDSSQMIDADYAKMAAMGGQAEVQMAQVALERSKNKDVRKFAQKMISDHTKNNQELQKVAGMKQMTLPTGLSDEQTQQLSNLRTVSMDSFDQTYIQVAGVDSHQKMQMLNQNQISNGTDADLKAFAQKTLPVVNMHLEMAQKMANGKMTMKNGSMK